MNTAQLLSLVIKVNREIMQHASAARFAAETDSKAYWEAEQIYRDAEKAFDDAKRAARYGFPRVED
jgi:hypothetical protein